MLKRSLLFNLIIVGLLVGGLLYAFFSSLDYLTNHGKETKVPELVGKSLEVAIKNLKNQGFTVEVDSTYQSYKNPMEVLFQEPSAGAIAKIGRTVFLTVNKRSIPKINMPNLVNLSFRNAILTMQSYRLVMGDTIYRPDVAAGAVLEQQINGQIVKPGTPIPYGSRISLVIGEGLTEEREVPNLIGATWANAKSTIESMGFTHNVLWDGTITDSMSAIVYQQTPEAINELDFKNTLLVGDLMDLRIMQNPSQELLAKNQPGSKKLLGTSDSSVSADPMPEQPINNVAPKVKDTTPRTRVVPGTKVPSASKKETEPKDNKTTKPSVNDKPIGTFSKETGKTKAKTNTKKTGEKEKQPVIKNSDDQIRNEYD